MTASVDRYAVNYSRLYRPADDQMRALSFDAARFDSYFARKNQPTRVLGVSIVSYDGDESGHVAVRCLLMIETELSLDDVSRDLCDLFGITLQDASNAAVVAKVELGLSRQRDWPDE